MSLLANQEIIGWSLLASGAIFIVSFIFLALMFMVKTAPFGPLNDITYVLSLFPILSYMVGIFGDSQPDYPYLALLALLTGITGIGMIMVTQVRLVLKNISLERNMPQGALGSGILGISFIINHLLIQQLNILPSRFNWLGLATGVLMAMGILTGLFYGREMFGMMTGKLDWTTANKLALAVIISNFVAQLGLNTWVFWLGSYLINLG